jgi:hypothetical protein
LDGGRETGDRSARWGEEWGCSAEEGCRGLSVGDIASGSALAIKEWEAGSQQVTGDAECIADGEVGE